MGEPQARAAGQGPRAGAPVLDGDALLRALAGGAAALSVQAEAINAINVFPVPDGDTGTNMSLTMRAALEGAGLDTKEAGAVARGVARGALMGAKGNSGVILSQILSGLSDAAELHTEIDARTLADGLDRGRAAAYRVVSAPKEGTILTAITDAARGALAAAGGGADVAETLEAAAAACEEAVRRTPELLPVLKEAGVVDSGAEGLFVLLEGMARTLRGESVAEHSGGFGMIDASWLAATRGVHAAGARSGFCTEFAVQGDALDREAIERALEAMGDSLIVVGGGASVRVHLHTQQPDDALAYAGTLGVITHQKVDDMEAQFQRLAGTSPAAGIAVVSVGAGSGIEELMRSLGANVVRGGQTMNPSAGDIRDAIIACASEDVIVLPNNKNIVMAARQAAEGLDRRVSVIESESVPQGVAALVAFNPEAAPAENLDAMTAATAGLRHAEVTFAARATRLHGLAIREGQPIAIVDGDLAVAEDTVEDAVTAAVRRMTAGAGTLVTLYAGEGATRAGADALADRLRSEIGCEVEVVEGGQPHYPYFIGVE